MTKENPSEVNVTDLLHVLLVDDSEDDVLFIIRELKKGGYNPVYERVDTAADMKKALEEKHWDIILCDYNMPKFNAPSAIALLKETNMDIPIIIISGAIGEETAVECMRLGAHDYFMKGKLSRLCRAIARELEETEVRNKKNQAEEALRENEEKYRLVVENATDVILIVQEGKIKFSNRHTLELLAYSLEELTAKPFIEFIYPDDRKMVMERHIKRISGEAVPDVYAFRIVTASGTVRWVEIHAVMITWEDKPATLNFINDITERKQAEEALVAREKELHLLAEAMPQIVWITRADGWNTYFNQQWVDYTGLTLEESYGHGWNKPFHPDDQQRAWDAWQNAVTNNGSYSIECRLRQADGAYRWWLIRGVPVIDKNGEISKWFGTCTDIEEIKQAEEALRQSESKYRLLADNVNDVIFVLDMNLNYTYVSPSSKILRGYEPEEVMKVSPADTLTPSSWDLIVRTLSEVMELEKIKQIALNESRTIPLEMKRKDGTTVWTEVKLSFIRDKDQQPVGILGVTRDITGRMQAEKELQQTLDSLNKALATTIQLMVSVVEVRDPYTAGHQLRVADLARAIAREMGLDQEKMDGIRMAGSIHDIGKLSVPAEILSKPTRLTNIEFSMIKEHSLSGYEMLKDVSSPWPLAQIVYQHHERMDGSGYPRNLKGDEIILEARIMAVADVVEAMASHRPYRPSLGIEAALEEIEKKKGILYDQDVAAACLRLFREKGYQLT